jgi:hypothetical protein
MLTSTFLFLASMRRAQPLNSRDLREMATSDKIISAVYGGTNNKRTRRAKRLAEDRIAYPLAPKARSAYGVCLNAPSADIGNHITNHSSEQTNKWPLCDQVESVRKNSDSQYRDEGPVDAFVVGAPKQKNAAQYDERHMYRVKRVAEPANEPGHRPDRILRHRGGVMLDYPTEK